MPARTWHVEFISFEAFFNSISYSPALTADTVSFTVHIPTNKGVLPVAFEHLRRDQACSQLSRLLNRWHAVAIAKLDVHGHLILPLLAPLPAIIPEDGSQYEILCAGDPVPQLVGGARILRQRTSCIRH